MTLIELIAVTAIMIVLISLLIPAFGNIGKANALTAEGNRLDTLIGLARQNSLTKNTLTALVMNTDPGTDGNLRSFSIWELNTTQTGTTPGAAPVWKQLTKWETFRTGVAVYQPADNSWEDRTPSVDFPPMKVGGKTVGSYKYRIFQSTGGLWGPEPVNIQLVEGVVSSGSSEVTLTRPNGNDPANKYEITIIPTTGRTKITRS